MKKARDDREKKLAERHHLGLNIPAAAPGKVADATPVPISPHQRQGNRGSKDDAPLRRLVRYRDLVASGVVGNWPQLLKLIAEHNFPPGRMLSANVRAWVAADVEEWVNSRPLPRVRAHVEPEPERPRAVHGREPAAAE